MVKGPAFLRERIVLECHAAVSPLEDSGERFQAVAKWYRNNRDHVKERGSFVTHAHLW